MTIPVQVPIETIIVRNEFILPLVVQFALEIHVLEDREIGLISRQRDGSYVYQSFLAVIIQNLKYINITADFQEATWAWLLHNSVTIN